MKQHCNLLMITLCLAALPASHLHGDALELDGNGDIVTFPSTDIPSGNGSFTIEAWINPTTIPTGGENGGQITFWGNQTGNQANGFRLRGAAGTRHYFWGNDHDENLGINILGDTTGPNADGWHYLAITWNGTQTQWYFNGTPLGSPRTAAGGVNVQALNHRIGSRLNAEFFHGFMDEIRIWNRALSTVEIAELFDKGLSGNEANLVAYYNFEGGFDDLAGGNNNGTPVGDARINTGQQAPVQTDGPRITSFGASPIPAFEGGTLTFAWEVDASDVTGDLLVEILDDNDQVIHAVADANGMHAIPVPDTAGVVQNLTYRLRASESGGEMVSREDSVNVVFDPGIPVADAQPDLVVQGVTPLNITLTATDPNNFPNAQLSYRLLSSPSGGQLNGTPPNLTYTANGGFGGFDSFTFAANDGKYDSAPATVTIRVVAPPTAPTGVLLNASAIDVTAPSGTILGTLSSIDANLPDDSHTYALVAGFGDNNLVSIAGDKLVSQTGFATLLGSNLTFRVRTTDSTARSFEGTLLLTVIEVDGGLVINEIHYNSLVNTSQEEFIELFNGGAASINLNGWSFSGGVTFRFTNDVAIEAGGYLVVAQDPGTVQSRFAVSSYGPWTGNLDNDGEEIVVRNGFGQRVDAVDFRSEFPWPIAANGAGGSMQLFNPASDNNLGSSWKALAAGPGIVSLTPGERNSVFLANPPPNIRQVNHSPKQPLSSESTVITAKVTDSDGVGSVVMRYQEVAPGQYIPAFIPLSVPELNANPDRIPDPNPAFEDPANWTTVAMVDDGTNGDATAGDSIYTAVLSPKINRTLMRYRITVTDSLGATHRAPFADDPTLNFAYFVYDGVPDYEGVPASNLETLPVYTMITRAQDMVECTAYNGSFQIAQFNGGVANEARFAFNWPAAIVYEGIVYDHIKYRLRGANGRYQSGKRNFRVRFNDGHFFAARDQDGKRYPRKWSRLNTGKGQSNRETLTFGLNEIINYYLFQTTGVESPRAHWFHFRVIDDTDEDPGQYTGDFWGSSWVQENYDVRFLEAHNLPKGNVYKLINSKQNALEQLRYQAPFAPSNGEDHDNIENSLTGSSTADYIRAHVNITNWYSYHAICEGVRNYDFWPSANKNAGWYFEPIYTAANGFRGRMMTLPWDTDSSWGPTWNSGHDVVYNSIFPASGAGSDGNSTPELQPEYRNAVREIRDLLFQEDQINSIIDAFAARFAPFAEADLTRWANAPSSQGSYASLNSPGPALSGGLAAYVDDLKAFMFQGGSWPGGSVGPGGQVVRMDAVATDSSIPATPTISYVGAPGFPIDGLVFETTPFSDPQGSGTFGAVQWRIAEVNAPGQVVTNPSDLKLEWNAAWGSGPLTTQNNQIVIPAFVTEGGKFYRARVQFRDNTGRWSHWSDPFLFVPSPADVVGILQRNLIITELNYNPLPEGPIPGDEFEFVELKNKGTLDLDLSGLLFSQGINYTFPSGTILTPGQVYLIARNPAVFATRYPGVPVDGDYDGRLDNGGETLVISHPQGPTVLRFSYNDRAPWVVSPDGFGFTLVIVDELGPLQSPGNWRASSAKGGSPGQTDPAPPASIGAVVINEILTSSTLPDLDSIELHNPSGASVDVSGWFLTDEVAQPKKFQIPAGTLIGPGGFVSFNETQFNSGAAGSFLLSSLGEQVYLFSGDLAGDLTGYTHGFSFGAAADGVSFGRYLNSQGVEYYPAQESVSLNNVNAGPLVGPVVITEVMYRPPDILTPTNTLNDSLNEFVEIKNISPTSVSLFDPTFTDNTWQLRGGVDFFFPQFTTLMSGEYVLLVNFNPATMPLQLAEFRNKYNVDPGVRIFGPFLGNLSNSGEAIVLRKPEPPLMPPSPNAGVVPYVDVDRVDYEDDLPWPPAADGMGPSLNRLDMMAFANDPANWFAALPTAASDPVGGASPVINIQPLSQDVTAGTTVMFSVGASGSNLQYQWLVDGEIIVGANQSTLVLSGAQPANSGSYRAIVFNPSGSQASDLAVLKVAVPPFIVRHPVQVTVDEGNDFTMEVVASGLPPITFQWFLNGNLLPGQTSSTLTVTGATEADDGLYMARVSNPNGSIVSTPARAIVLISPEFLTPYSTLYEVVQGSDVVLSMATRGTLPMGYRWRSNSFTFRNVTNNAHSDFAVLRDIQPSGGAGIRYTVVINNIAFPTPGLLSRPNISIDVLPDTDGDGMSDRFEMEFNLQANDPTDANEDLDGDGMTNLEEQIACTDPTDPTSYLKIEEINLNGGIQLEFEAKSNKTYTIEFKDEAGLLQWTWLTDVVSRPTNSTVVVTDTIANPERYYRLITPKTPLPTEE